MFPYMPLPHQHSVITLASTNHDSVMILLS